MPMSRTPRSFWLGSSTSPPLITRSNLSFGPIAACTARARDADAASANVPARNFRLDLVCICGLPFGWRLAYHRAHEIASACVDLRFRRAAGARPALPFAAHPAADRLPAGRLSGLPVAPRRRRALKGARDGGGGLG